MKDGGGGGAKGFPGVELCLPTAPRLLIFCPQHLLLSPFNSLLDTWMFKSCDGYFSFFLGGG